MAQGELRVRGGRVGRRHGGRGFHGRAAGGLLPGPTGAAAELVGHGARAHGVGAQVRVDGGRRQAEEAARLARTGKASPTSALGFRVRV